ncbi:unnamed protein product [Leptidea sinapis]|uniref:Cadherin domain-containing protein n=1 Tax=Leptidea sinapis TaxID=189913 RepID=A0A5E4R6E7_9NEOP|nr:unnamed protein product [Leptidea sinapis]
MVRGHGELFRVERRSGRVTLKQTLDAHRPEYTLRVAAFDGAPGSCYPPNYHVPVCTPHEARRTRTEAPCTARCAVEPAMSILQLMHVA